MPRYIATVDIPLNFEVEAGDIQTARTIVDDRFAEAYDLIDDAIAGWRAREVWPIDCHIGARYDDTAIEPDRWQAEDR